MLRELLVATVLVAATFALAPAGAEGVVAEATSGPGYTGWKAEPEGTPAALVLVAHGYGHTAADWDHHLVTFAEHGALAVAVDYGNWEVSAGADALVAAAAALGSEDVPTVLFVVSMGGAMAGTALQRAPAGTFDLVMMSEAVSRLDETYAEAVLAAQAAPIAANTVREIEAECGGPPADPACLAAASYALHSDALAAAGVAGAWVVHDVNDGLVPYDQGVQGAAALRAAGVPTSFTTVLRGPCGDTGTTLTGYAGQRDVACVAGHSTETSTTQAVIRHSLDLVLAYLDGGAAPAEGTHLYDQGATVP